MWPGIRGVVTGRGKFHYWLVFRLPIALGHTGTRAHGTHTHTAHGHTARTAHTAHTRRRTGNGGDGSTGGGPGLPCLEPQKRTGPEQNRLQLMRVKLDHLACKPPEGGW